jgi:hypothetical protein
MPVITYGATTTMSGMNNAIIYEWFRK